MSRHVSRNLMMLTAMALALALAGGAGWVHAQDPQAKGSVSGVVLSADGKPMVGFADGHVEAIKGKFNPDKTMKANDAIRKLWMIRWPTGIRRSSNVP